MTSQEKKPISPFTIFKKKLTIDLLSLGVYAPGHQVLTYRTQTQVMRIVRIWSPSVLRTRIGVLKGFAVWRPEGGNSPFRGARPKLTS